jgi:conjugal transfer pilus assembly protein TraD
VATENEARPESRGVDRELFAPKDSIRDLMPQGSSWIHGMEPKKGLVPFHYKAMGGHTLVGGTTGAGKTRTYEVISTQVIHLGDVLMIVDPKNDKEWKERVERSASAPVANSCTSIRRSRPSRSASIRSRTGASRPKSRAASRS